MVTRRAALGMVAGGAAAAAIPAWAGEAIGPSLDVLARAKGLRFGSAISAPPPPHPRAALDDARYCAVMAYECGVLVATNEMKHYAIHPHSPDEWQFAGADRIVDFAEANAMGVRGHTLLWAHPDYSVKWLREYDFGPQPGAAAAKMLAGHIRRTCAHFGTRVQSWDVVNEAIDHKTGELRDHPFGAIGKIEAIDLAFHTAREAAPHAELVYNDYMSWARGDELHRAAVLRLLEGFRKRGVPVDALGIQSHIGDPHSDRESPFGVYDEKAWRAFLDAVTGMGYRLHVTELDVGDKRLPADIASRDRACADLCKAWLDILCGYPALRDILFWGIVDRYSWLRGLTPRADGALKRPLPYDDEYRPKPMRDAVAAALKGAVAR
ncbi:endo-1,4-beta-xylanase [Sphingomonas canadensis]|uniref:Beta-xylanase n=1 Tax=Sphingomonas canadensis TaxID=1219257 RepID=A0ABW3HER2_9SPHN|nr:endo-1,4-beta-xylanase [Sphingomonas canadensis]MCW3837708.1 endo-1,4-beta-xylanase [Sphingomonas canadensis]